MAAPQAREDQSPPADPVGACAQADSTQEALEGRCQHLVQGTAALETELGALRGELDASRAEASKVSVCRMREQSCIHVQVASRHTGAFRKRSCVCLKRMCSLLCLASQLP